MTRRFGPWHVLVIMAMLAVPVGLASAAEGGHGEEAAHADEAAHGDGHGSTSIWAGDLGNVVWTLAIFLTVVYVLGKYAWNPLLGALQKREQFIRESLASAKTERQEAEKLLQQYTEQINKAREEATAICDEARRDAEEVRRRIESEAREEADNIIKRAKREIEIAHQDAVNEIYKSAAEMATSIAGRILEREVSPDDHRELVSASVEAFKEKGGLGST